MRMPRDMRLTSGSPWHIEFAIERIGDDVLCRIHGGDRHIGAVALSQWHPQGPETDILAVSGHKEQAIAEHAAHSLCMASQRSVSCIAGIHFDSLEKVQIDEIVQAVHLMIGKAAHHLEHLRRESAGGRNASEEDAD